jgi:hypothetical protein
MELCGLGRNMFVLISFISKRAALKQQIYAQTPSGNIE